MNKLLLVCLFFASLNAATIAKIVASVNSLAITSIDVKEAQNELNISYDEALEKLLEQRLLISLAKRYELSVNELEIDEELRNLVSKNSIDLQNQDGKQIAKIRNNLKEEILKQKLFSFIAASHKKEPSEEEMSRFYEQNKAKMNGAGYEQVKEQIWQHLSNLSAYEAINSFIEKEKQKAVIKIFD